MLLGRDPKLGFRFLGKCAAEVVQIWETLRLRTNLPPLKLPKKKLATVGCSYNDQMTPSSYLHTKLKFFTS